MNVFSGIIYNYKGVKLGVKTPRLLALGLVRLLIIVVITVVSAGFVLAYFHEILSLIWSRPESPWVLWLWHLVSWLVALLLLALSVMISFLISQILFSVVIMDAMSKITEQQLTGEEKKAVPIPWLTYYFYLLRQEIPRAIIPVMIALVLMVLGWFTPLSPVLTMISSLLAAVFLAWDNTDLVPARRLETFGSRFKFLIKNLTFHLGFGLWFLIPVLNIVFLSFAPVGATLFYIEQVDGKAS